jgi:hypothetical protein
MASTFAVTPVVSPDAKWSVVPSNVTFIRPIFDVEQMHTKGCENGDGEGTLPCPFGPQLPEADTVGMYAGCTEKVKGEYTEILFVNTIGPQSSVVVKESVAKVRELIDAGLRG